MSELDRMGSNSSRMTKEEIMQRGFASKVRGISESEVRAFLKRIAEEIDQAANREEELLGKIADLENRLNSKPKVSRHELLENLGEETARVLSSAEEAAQKMVTEAQDEAEKLTTNAKTKADDLVAKAKAQAEEKMSETQSRAKSLQESAQRNATTIIEESRVKGREVYQEAVVVREQILKDLLRRRDLLLEQIDELRNGREELLESYKVVKGSFQKATDALQSVEAKASSELMSNPIDVDSLLKTPVQLPEVLDPSKSIDPGAQLKVSSTSGNENNEETHHSNSNIKIDSEPDENQSDPASAETGQKERKFSRYMKDALGVGEENSEMPEVSSTVTPITPESVTIVENSKRAEKLIKNETEDKEEKAQKKDVGALFESLKKQTDSETVDLTNAEKKDNATGNTDNATGKTADKTPKAVKSSEKSDVTKKKETKPAKKVKQKNPIEVRDEYFSEALPSLLRKAKRQLQDEQNEVLETLRTIKSNKSKKRIASENVLAEEETHTKAWAEFLRQDLENTFIAGAKVISKDNFKYGEDEIHAAIAWIISPLRETLQLAIDEGDQAEASSRVGARYREWRNSDLKNALFDAMSSAYNNGIVAASDEGKLLSWKVVKAGQCPDCDDNSLESTPSGESFPTGQIAPPAHSGCKCVLALA